MNNTPQRIKQNNLPISRELTLERYKRELADIQEKLAHFHDELLVDSRDATITYTRIYLTHIHEGVSDALHSLERLEAWMKDNETSVTEVAEKAKAVKP